jgi:hypothetical protein
MFKESQSTVMLYVLKCFDCFVFGNFISHFSDERLTSEAYPYQSALFLDDVLFFLNLNIFCDRHFLQEHRPSREIMSDYLQSYFQEHVKEQDYIKTKIE